jgi:hypothetical protein
MEFREPKGACQPATSGGPIPNNSDAELAINFKSAKVLSLEIPPKLLALADEVI